MKVFIFSASLFFFKRPPLKLSFISEPSILPEYSYSETYSLTLNLSISTSFEKYSISSTLLSSKNSLKASSTESFFVILGTT